MALPSLFVPALLQIEARWPALSAEQKAKMVDNLPSLEERLTCLDWNARLSAMSPRFLEPCQAVYQGLSAWNDLSDMEKIVVFMAGVEPITSAAAAMGLISGIKAVS